jgi:hypothetical protein
MTREELLAELLAELLVERFGEPPEELRGERDDDQD